MNSLPRPIRLGRDYGLRVHRGWLLTLVSIIPIINWIFTVPVEFKAICWDHGPVCSVFNKVRLWRACWLRFYDMFFHTCDTVHTILVEWASIVSAEEVRVGVCNKHGEGFIVVKDHVSVNQCFEQCVWHSTVVGYCSFEGSKKLAFINDKGSHKLKACEPDIHSAPNTLKHDFIPQSCIFNDEVAFLES